jgi:hypothetical protein
MNPGNKKREIGKHMIIFGVYIRFRLEQGKKIKDKIENEKTLLEEIKL